MSRFISQGALPRKSKQVVLRSARELEELRQAGQIVAQVLQEIAGEIGPDMTARELDARIDRSIRASGAVPTFKGYHGFPAASCISVNDAVVHGIPGDYRFRKGDLVSVDVGATLHGYVGDGAFTFLIPPESPEHRRLIAVTQQALAQGIAAAQAGRHVGDISFAVQATVEAAGFSVVREYCGHGVGTSIHEEPQVPNFGRRGGGPLLRPGMVLAIEPMVNAGQSAIWVEDNGWTVRTADGRPSAHFEHTVAITEAGPSILTEIRPDTP